MYEISHTLSSLSALPVIRRFSSDIKAIPQTCPEAECEELVYGSFDYDNNSRASVIYLNSNKEETGSSQDLLWRHLYWNCHPLHVDDNPWKVWKLLICSSLKPNDKQNVSQCQFRTFESRKGKTEPRHVIQSHSNPTAPHTSSLPPYGVQPEF